MVVASHLLGVAMRTLLHLPQRRGLLHTDQHLSLLFNIVHGSYAPAFSQRQNLMKHFLGNHDSRDQIKSFYPLQTSRNRKTNLNEIPMDADLFGTTLYIREKLRCPKGGVYSLGKL